MSIRRGPVAIGPVDVNGTAYGRAPLLRAVREQGVRPGQGGFWRPGWEELVDWRVWEIREALGLWAVSHSEEKALSNPLVPNRPSLSSQI